MLRFPNASTAILTKWDGTITWDTFDKLCIHTAKGQALKVGSSAFEFHKSNLFLKDVFLEQLKLDEPEPLCTENKNLTPLS